MYISLKSVVYLLEDWNISEDVKLANQMFSTNSLKSCRNLLFLKEIKRRRFMVSFRNWSVGPKNNWRQIFKDAFTEKMRVTGTGIFNNKPFGHFKVEDELKMNSLTCLQSKK